MRISHKIFTRIIYIISYIFKELYHFFQRCLGKFFQLIAMGIRAYIFLHKDLLRTSQQSTKMEEITAAENKIRKKTKNATRQQHLHNTKHLTTSHIT